jgi:sRNA-binding regulator protein Hfq
MKEAGDSNPSERALQPEGFANRKLIRPSLNRADHGRHSPMAGDRERSERVDRLGHSDRNGQGEGGRKMPPPEQTNAENFYYQKQMQSKTPMVIVLRDGEQIRGTLEWYDKSCVKVTRNGAASLMIYKPAIKYMYKEGETGNG